MKILGRRLSTDRGGLFPTYEGKFLRGLIYQAGAILISISIILSCAVGCEKRIIRKQERIFMHYAEKNWSKLTARQKADYYEMLQRQKDRARKEGVKEEQRRSQGF